MAPSLALVLAYAENRLYRFVAAQHRCDSYFGGPISVQVRGKKHGPDPLHQVVYLSAIDIPLLPKHFFGLPLLYGLRYSGCCLQYTLPSIEEVRLVEMTPTRSSKNWPYQHYPPILPSVQLALADCTRCSWRKFTELLDNAPATMPCDVYVVVPPPFAIGVSLWGRDGDDEGTYLAWEYCAESNSVRAYNRCS